MDLKGIWLICGYFDVSDKSGGQSITQQIRDSLANQLGKHKMGFRIANYPIGPVWRHTYWWREGKSDYAEAQFYARIAEDYPILSIGISIEKGLEDPRVVPSAKRATMIMNRNRWDWQRFKNRAKDILTDDVPACASLTARPIELRFNSHRYSCKNLDKGKAQERRAFVFYNGDWFERHKGKVVESTILNYIQDLDQKKDWWVNTYFGCDLFPNEVEGMKVDAFANIMSSFNTIRKRIRDLNLKRK